MSVNRRASFDESAFHLPSQETCDGLHELLFGFSERLVLLFEKKHHAAHQITLRQNRCAHAEIIPL